MEKEIVGIVRELNNSGIEVHIEYFKLGNKLCIKEYPKDREPKMNLFEDFEDCYKYVKGLKNLYSNIQEIKDEKQFDIWYMGEYLGSFNDSTYDGACKKALLSIGVLEFEADNDVKYRKYKFFKS